MFGRSLIWERRWASRNPSRRSHPYKKSKLAGSLSRVDGAVEEIYRYLWGVCWVTQNKHSW
jgi:hypothetical protein